MNIFETVHASATKTIKVYNDTDKDISISRFSVREYTYANFIIMCGKKVIPHEKWQPNDVGSNYQYSYHIDFDSKVIKPGKSISFNVKNRYDFDLTFEGWFGADILSYKQVQYQALGQAMALPIRRSLDYLRYMNNVSSIGFDGYK